MIQLHGQSPQQSHPEQHGLLGHGSIAVKGQISAWKRTVATANQIQNMIISRAPRKETLHLADPGQGDGRLCSDADQRRRWLRISLFLWSLPCETGIEMGRKMNPKCRRFFLKRLVKINVQQEISLIAGWVNHSSSMSRLTVSTNCFQVNGFSKVAFAPSFRAKAR